MCIWVHFGMGIGWLWICVHSLFHKELSWYFSKLLFLLNCQWNWNKLVVMLSVLNWSCLMERKWKWKFFVGRTCFIWIICAIFLVVCLTRPFFPFFSLVGAYFMKPDMGCGCFGGPVLKKKSPARAFGEVEGTYA